MTDFLLDENNDIQIVNGDFVTGESLTQEVAMILKASQGEFKSDPLIGANLVQMIKQQPNRIELDKRVKLHLQRDGKDYEAIKEYINLKQ